MQIRLAWQAMRPWLYCHKIRSGCLCLHEAKGMYVEMGREWYDRNYPEYEDMRKQARADRNRLRYHLMPSCRVDKRPKRSVPISGSISYIFSVYPFSGRLGGRKSGGIIYPGTGYISRRRNLFSSRTVHEIGTAFTAALRFRGWPGALFLYRKCKAGRQAV